MENKTLYFISARGEHRIVKENISQDEVIPTITAYVERLNPNFHIYYIRQWETKNHTIMYDVGSHTEFFEYYKGDM